MHIAEGGVWALAHHHSFWLIHWSFPMCLITTISVLWLRKWSSMQRGSLERHKKEINNMLGTCNMREGKQIIHRLCRNHKGASHSLLQCPGGKAKLIYTFVANYLAFAFFFSHFVSSARNSQGSGRPDDLHCVPSFLTCSSWALFPLEVTTDLYLWNVIILTIKSYVSMLDTLSAVSVIVNTVLCSSQDSYSQSESTEQRI